MARMRVYHRTGAGRPIRAVWALEEVGADYELVTMGVEEARAAEHRARHPLGRVPVLEDDEGPLFESTALVFHIAELNPDAGLLPPPARYGGDPERAGSRAAIAASHRSLAPAASSGSASRRR